uniref:Uncharacterized protein n=1 Tax=Arundo donax TaxID=35708 RepID=A0A0A8ZW30_ARUDO
MMQLGFSMNERTMFSMSCTILSGCPSTATLVSPGRSIRVRLTTFGEYMLK